MATDASPSSKPAAPRLNVPMAMAGSLRLDAASPIRTSASRLLDLPAKSPSKTTYSDLQNFALTSRLLRAELFPVGPGRAASRALPQQRGPPPPQAAGADARRWRGPPQGRGGGGQGGRRHLGAARRRRQPADGGLQVEHLICVEDGLLTTTAKNIIAAGEVLGLAGVL